MATSPSNCTTKQQKRLSKIQQSSFLSRIASRVGVFHIAAELIKQLIQRLSGKFLRHVRQFLVRFRAQAFFCFWICFFGDQGIVTIDDLVPLGKSRILIALDDIQRFFITCIGHRLDQAGDPIEEIGRAHV